MDGPDARAAQDASDPPFDPLAGGGRRGGANGRRFKGDAHYRGNAVLVPTFSWGLCFVLGLFFTFVWGETWCYCSLTVFFLCGGAGTYACDGMESRRGNGVAWDGEFNVEHYG